MIDLDSVLKCPTCGGTPYRVYRRQVRRADGSPGDAMESVLWPTDPGVMPPASMERVTCPADGAVLRRVAP